MTNNSKIWKGNWTFILAAAGSAVGLGNIWKFPYMAGENGGGAFVIIYLACIVLIGFPVMMSEIFLGKYGRSSPVYTMKKFVSLKGISSYWVLLGWFGALAGLMILSYYSVFAGISLAYIFSPIPADSLNPSQYSVDFFAQFQSSPMRMIFWHSLFLILTCFIVAKGVVDGIGATIKIIMPTLFFLIILLSIYSSLTGEIGKAISFLFMPDFSKISSSVIISAMGQAFFTLSLGMGAIMAYGAYIPEEQNLTKTVSLIIFLDTFVAIIAGIIIFPIVFANPELTPTAGPSLFFETLPVAFFGIPFSFFASALFFILVSLAALSSSVSLIEPSTAWMEDRFKISRTFAVTVLGSIAWLLGLGSLFSFNLIADFQIFSMSFLEFMDFLTNSIMLPLGGLFIALLVGWILSENFVKEEMKIKNELYWKIWINLTKYVAPILIGLVFIFALF